MVATVLIGGPIAVGKSTLAAGIAESTSAAVVGARRVLEETCGLDSATRIELQERGAIIDAETQGKWLADYITSTVDPRVAVVIDSVRTVAQAEHIRRDRAGVIVVYLDAPAHVRAARYRAAGDPVKVKLEFSKAMKHPTEIEVRSVASIADVKVDTTNLDPEGVLIRVMQALRSLGV